MVKKTPTKKASREITGEAAASALHVDLLHCVGCTTAGLTLAVGGRTFQVVCMDSGRQTFTLMDLETKQRVGIRFGHQRPRETPSKDQAEG